MQKKHLHLLLLVLLVIGCGRKLPTDQNPYIFKNQDIVIETSENKSTLLNHGPLALQFGRYLPDVFVQLAPFTERDQRWEIRWESVRQEPLDLPQRRLVRSLSALTVQDTAAGLALQAVALPDGQGVAVYLDGRAIDHFNVLLSANSPEPFLLTSPRRLNKQTIVYELGDGRTLAVGAAGGIEQVVRVNPGSPAGAWRLNLEKYDRRQLVLAAGLSADAAAAAVEARLNKKPADVETQTREALAARLAFTVNTADDRFNQMFALLIADLAGGAIRLPISTLPDIENAAQAAAAFYLAARQPSAIVFPASRDPRDQFTTQQTRDFLRWGSAAYAATLRYGMTGEDSLRSLSLRILTELSRLQGEYYEADLAVLVEPVPDDSASRLAAAHIRLAGLMTLGEQVAIARGDANAQGEFRGAALRAGRRSREMFNRAARLYRNAVKLRKQQAEQLVDPFTETAEPPPSTDLQIGPPDTLRLLRAGACYGFGWLSNESSRLWDSELSGDGFLWQRWVAHRFSAAADLQTTPDLDSLIALVLDGPAPGLIGDGNPADAPPLLTTAAAVQNIAEVYLGVRPDAFRARVDIEPHIPLEWGPVTARIPFESGFLHVHYDLAREQAYVGMTDIEHDVKVFFGFPLPDGGYVRTQFILNPGEPVQRIKIVREAGNRWRLKVDAAAKNTFAS